MPAVGGMTEVGAVSRGDRTAAGRDAPPLSRPPLLSHGPGHRDTSADHTGSAMTATIDSLETALNRDLSLAWSELAEATARQSRKDTPAHRAAVAEILARIDALL